MGREGPTGGNGFTGMVDDFALWKRALALSEIQTIYTNGLAGLSLGDLLRQPTDTIEFVSVRKTTGPDALEITFHNLGPWQTFRLLRSAQLNGPFQIVPDLAPVSLGSDQYRFTYPLGADSVEYFRVEGSNHESLAAGNRAIPRPFVEKVAADLTKRKSFREFRTNPPVQESPVTMGRDAFHPRPKPPSDKMRA